MIVYQKNPADGTGPSNKKLEEKKNRKNYPKYMAIGSIPLQQMA